MRLAGIVLCGGKSKRMGYPKALLPFGSQTLLEHVLETLKPLVEYRLVVAASGQELPQLCDDINILHDLVEGAGPLGGIYRGLSNLPNEIDAAFITCCDAPLLKPEFLQKLAEHLQDHEVIVPKSDGYHHPLSAIYRTSIVGQVKNLLDNDRMRPLFLFESVNTKVIEADFWQDVDPDSDSLRNCNTPEDYLKALAQAGHSIDEAFKAKLMQNNN